MLVSLNIHNIALISQCSINLGKGLNILSGETGAGKSIIIDSLTFVLGDRADKSLIRSGESLAVVQAIFDIDLSDALSSCLDELGIDKENTIIIERKMTSEGKNECRINGKAVTLGMLRKLTTYLADIYGQHEHQSILNRSNHVTLLDSYGGHSSLLNDVADCYNALVEIKSKLNRFGNEDEIKRKLETLQYQIGEIIKADIKEGEEEKLITDRTRYMSSEKILTGVSGAHKLITEAETGLSAESSIISALPILSSVTQFDEGLSKIYDRLDSLAIELKDISSALNDYIDSFDFDPKKADYVEKRIDEIKFIKRKYGSDYNVFLNKAREEYDNLSNSDDVIKLLKQKYSESEDKLLAACKALSLSRAKAANRFENEIMSELSNLGMSGTTFKVSINVNIENVTELGYDDVEFLISPNRGEPLKPLIKIISGGEMSRFMLAIKNITAKLEHIDCMVFDEIDSGISGHIAQVVSMKLSNISKDRQVIAVTHLPQLAAMADKHYLIEKSVVSEKTLTAVTLLDYDRSIKEVARLIGGSDYSGYALPHAREMLEHSANYKKSII